MHADYQVSLRSCLAESWELFGGPPSIAQHGIVGFSVLVVFLKLTLNPEDALKDS